MSVVGESSQNTTATSTPHSTVLADDQTLPMQVTQQAAHVAIQLQQGHGITLASDQDGQQIYVVADPSQLEALQVSIVAMLKKMEIFLSYLQCIITPPFHYFNSATGTATKHCNSINY